VVALPNIITITITIIVIIIIIITCPGTNLDPKP